MNGGKLLTWILGIIAGALLLLVGRVFTASDRESELAREDAQALRAEVAAVRVEAAAIRTDVAVIKSTVVEGQLRQRLEQAEKDIALLKDKAGLK